MDQTTPRSRFLRWTAALFAAILAATAPSLPAATAASPSLPDLVVTDLKLQDAGGFQFKIQFKIKNRGKADAGATTAVLIPGTDTNKQVLQVDPLKHGKSQQFSLQLPDPVARGIAPQFYIDITVDPGNSVPESNENNNHLVAPLTLDLAGLPDLIVERVSIDQTKVSPPEVKVTVRVKNQGKGDALAFDVHAWQPEQNPANGVTLNLSAGLKSGKSHDFQFTSQPLNPDPATYMAEVDPTNAVKESDEGNNQGSGQRKLQVDRKLPDLVVQNVRVALDSTGPTLVVSYSIRNDGGGDVTTGIVTLARQEQGKFQDEEVIVGGLKAGASSDQEIDFPVGQVITDVAGTRVWITVDPNNAVAESNEANNAMSGTIPGGKRFPGLNTDLPLKLQP